MEGPTPVSALLHAATMVTAGVFLILRSSIFMEYSDNILNLLCIFGCITALFSGMVATFQYDIKRIIAYSTCSQLGYMFFSCGLSNYFVAFFHLFNHAFFKALLFLSSGALIHSLFDEQDIRKMGSLFKILPLIYLAMFIGSLAIVGFPFLSGFYSKDVILELVYSRFYINAIFIYIIALIAALFTAIYSCKLFFYVFFLNYNFNFSYLIY
jgi:NADH:ubiquinone oxidoreductase subunit 5 (subunit L)/multisubunit Na+/H+ antiporter MnhA subunit